MQIVCSDKKKRKKCKIRKKIKNWLTLIGVDCINRNTKEELGLQ